MKNKHWPAHGAIRTAKSNGSIQVPAACQKCGKKKPLHGHHDNYEKPLEVRWLCPKCHGEVHKELGWGKRGRPRLYNFDALGVFDFAIIKGEKMARLSSLAHAHSALTGKKLKTFTSPRGIVVMRIL